MEKLIISAPSNPHVDIFTNARNYHGQNNLSVLFSQKKETTFTNPINSIVASQKLEQLIDTIKNQLLSFFKTQTEDNIDFATLFGFIDQNYKYENSPIQQKLPDFESRKWSKAEQELDRYISKILSRFKLYEQAIDTFSISSENQSITKSNLFHLLFLLLGLFVLCFFLFFFFKHQKYIHPLDSKLK